MNGLEKDFAYYRQLLMRYANGNRSAREIKGLRRRLVNLIDNLEDVEDKEHWYEMLMDAEASSVRASEEYDDEYQLMLRAYRFYKHTGDIEAGLKAHDLKSVIIQGLKDNFDMDLDIQTYTRYKEVFLIEDLDYGELVKQKMLDNLADGLGIDEAIAESFKEHSREHGSSIESIMEWSKKEQRKLFNKKKP